MNFKNSVEKSVFPLAEYFQFSRKLFRLNQRCFFLRTKTWTFLHASLTTWFDRSYSRKCYIYKQEKRKFFSLCLSLSSFIRRNFFFFLSLFPRAESSILMDEAMKSGFTIRSPE